MNEHERRSLVEENALLREEVRVAREAAAITASAVVRQFEETERVLQRLQALSAEQRAVLDAASQVAVVAADRQGTIRLFNPGAERLLGYGAGEVVGLVQTAALHLPEELGEHARALTEELGRPVTEDEVLPTYAETGRAAVREWTLLRKDGRRVPVDESVTALRGAEGEFTGFLCVALDLTERKRAEDEIRAAMEATEAANRTKSAFLANMSHELRTPLNAIIGYSEMLGEEAEAEGLESLGADLAKIRASGQHLLALINDILDISKIEAGRVELFLEDLRIAELVGDVERTVEPLVARNDNTFVVTCPPDVGAIRADALRLKQVLFNLLSNAAKFTERGRIELAVSVEPPRPSEIGPRVCFEVGDSGIGMTAPQLGKLFRPFVQADASTTRKFGGTGLGLAISKEFTELMGGTLEVSSVPGERSRFTVRLPRNVELPTRAEVPPGRASPHEATLPAMTRLPVEAFSVSLVDPLRGTVLVVDDDAATREVLQHHLERAGYRVVTACDGNEGLARARALHPDVITLDVMMPGRDGWLVLSELKADPATREIPVIMVTILDARNAGYALGADDYLVKPVDRVRLLHVLENHRPRDTRVPSALVVDDSADARDLLAQLLAKEGYEVVCADNGAVALERLAEAVPSVILLDLMMPVMDGFVFLEHLRAQPTWRAVPVIVVTAMDLGEEERRLLSGKVEGVLGKGAHTRSELLDELRRLVEAGMARRSRAPTPRPSTSMSPEGPASRS